VILNNSNESYVENNKSIHLIRGVKALKNCECALKESCFEQHGLAKINKLLYLLYKNQTVKVLIFFLLTFTYNLVSLSGPNSTRARAQF
jgi:hypothetical protein